MRGLSDLPLLVVAAADPGLPEVAVGLCELSTSGLRLVGVNGAHLIPALTGGASESTGELFLGFAPGEIDEDESFESSPCCYLRSYPFVWSFFQR